MARDPITEQRGTELAPLLGKRGWQVLERTRDGLEWWADESWTIQAGPTTAHLTFLVDPMDRSSVWALAATRDLPTGAVTGGAVIRLRHVWHQDLPRWLDAVDALKANAGG